VPGAMKTKLHLGGGLMTKKQKNELADALFVSCNRLERTADL